MASGRALCLTSLSGLLRLGFVVTPPMVARYTLASDLITKRGPEGACAQW
jgi:hypothetical protein